MEGRGFSLTVNLGKPSGVESVWEFENLCRSWLQPRRHPREIRAALAAEVPILQFCPLYGNNPNTATPLGVPT
jgi:hypothetical protein